jgi:hypothetical protein
LQLNSRIILFFKIIIFHSLIIIFFPPVCYSRNLFPAECFAEKPYGGDNLPTIFQLESARVTDDGNIEIISEDAFRLTQWLEKGVFEALGHKYVKSMTFAIMEGHEDNPELLETYTFEIGYEKVGTKTLPTLNGLVATKENLKKQACTFIRNLTVFAGSLDVVPDNRWLTMKLTYFDDVTPPDYEPEYFAAQSEENHFRFPTNKKILRIKVGQLNTSSHSMQLRFAHVDDTILEDPESSSEQLQMKSKIPASLFLNSGDDSNKFDNSCSDNNDQETQQKSFYHQTTSSNVTKINLGRLELGDDNFQSTNNGTEESEVKNDTLKNKLTKHM